MLSLRNSMTNKTTITLTLAIASILIASPFAIPSSNADSDLMVLFDPEGPVPGPVMSPSIMISGDVEQAEMTLLLPNGAIPAVCDFPNGDVGIQILALECIVHEDFTYPGEYCWTGTVTTFAGEELPLDICPAFEILAEPPQVQLTKTCEVTDEIEPGTIEWGFIILNSGDTTIIESTLNDPQLEALLGNLGIFPVALPSPLESGEVVSLTIDTTGLDAGTYTNQATVDVVNEFGLPNSDTSEEVSCTILPNQIDVDIDIKPGSFPNSIQQKSMGVVPVAILGSESFDVTEIDVTTIVFGTANAAPSHDLTDPETYAKHLQYANDDGFLDLVSHYKQKQTGIACGDTEATISGELFNGTPFEGTDSVNPICKP